MENASKALLIAGSILIAILLIAMGVKVFDSAEGTTDSAKTTMDTTAVAMFNNKFIPYFGANKTKSEVMSLCNMVLASNETSGKVVAIAFVKEKDDNNSTGSSQDIMMTASGLSSTKKYKITGAQVTAEGYLDLIKVEEQE